MKRISLFGVISFFLLSITFYPTVASALPVGWSTATVNGENVIVDTAGNQWLSPTATQGLSYNAAIASSWVTTYGFQSATQSQFTGLLADFGLRTTTTPGGFGPFNFEAIYGGEAKHFILSFGKTTFSYGSNPPSWLDINFGLYAPSYDPSMAGMGGVGLLVWNGIEYGGVLNDPAYLNLTTADPTFGTWLYNPASPVPEPSTWLLMGSGLLGLIWVRRRQAKA